MLDHKAATAERERWQQSIETSSMTIACLNAEIESLHEEKSQMMSSAVERAKELGEAHSFAEERNISIKALEFNVQEYKIEREDLKSGSIVFAIFSFSLPFLSFPLNFLLTSFLFLLSVRLTLREHGRIANLEDAASATSS